ncbi:MAG: hypothetical protein K1X71_15915 [Pirellulales bacterium]|nr:hypothetical protein [Pirellulales bacterium]
MTPRFEHSDLDGQLNQLLGRGLLEIRDPNDGFLPDLLGMSRNQVVLVDGIVYARRIPRGETPRENPLHPRCADSYRGIYCLSQFRPDPYWNLDLILAFREHLAAGWPQIATRGSQTLRYEPATIQVILADCPQMLTCPDCGDLIESDSVDSVPEGRVCHDCGGV